MPTERTGGSGRHGGCGQVFIDIRGHPPRPELSGLAGTKLWLYVEIQEGVEENQRKERHQKEALDGVRVMLEYMIRMPTVDQLVEGMIFDRSEERRLGK